MSSMQAGASPLDNVIWNALRGPMAGFAEPGGDDDGVLRFDPEVSPFSASDAIDDVAWRALAKRVGAGGTVMLFRDEVAVAPEGWAEVFRAKVCQLVAEALPSAPGCDAVPLGNDDAPEMLALAQLTEPGPFLSRTHELGGYLGVRREGRLVAMAGRRFQVPGYHEVSAVCTHPDARGEGLGTALTLSVAEGIRAAGDEAYLHAFETNENALRLYESIGFRLRRMVDVVAATWQSD